MPRFFPTNSTPTRLTTALGTWSLVPGLPIDVDNRTAHILREDFGRAGLIVESAASPQSALPELLPVSTGWAAYNVTSASWSLDSDDVRIISSQAKPGAWASQIPAVAGATYQFSAGVTVSALNGAQGWWPYIIFTNSTGTILATDYSAAGSKITTTGTRTLTAVAPANTAYISVGFEVGADGGPTGAKDFTVTDLNLVKTVEAPAAEPLWKVTGTVLRKSANSQRVVMRGATLWALPMYGPWADFQAYSLNIYNNRDAIFTYMQAANVNCVRIGMVPESFTRGDDGDQTAILNRAAAIVASAKAKGITVLFTFWSETGSAPAVGAATSAFLTMQGQLYNRLGPDPYVMYNPLNEPNSISDARWVEINKSFLDFYRDTLGYKGVLVLDPNAWAGDFATRITSIDQVIAYSNSKSVPKNLLWSHHRYAQSAADGGFTSAPNAWNNVNHFESEVGSYMNRYPIAVTETGTYTGNPSSVNYTWNTEWWNYVRTNAIPRGLNGLLEFNWMWADNSMVNPGDSAGGSQQASALTTATSTQLTTPNANHGTPWRAFNIQLVDNVEPTLDPVFDPPIVETFGVTFGPNWVTPVDRPGITRNNDTAYPADTTNYWGRSFYYIGVGPNVEVGMEITAWAVASGQAQLYFGVRQVDPSFQGYVLNYNRDANYPQVAFYRDDTFLGNWVLPQDQVPGNLWIGVRRNGTTLQAFSKSGTGQWGLLGQVTDSTYTAASTDDVGIGFDYGGSATNRIDNFCYRQI